MSNKKHTIKAAKNPKTVGDSGDPVIHQGHLEDRWYRTHTPERDYPREDQEED
ncbi:hypothetical protein ACIGW3_26410 [Streptomyces sp. NPDC053499]|uniref:hypothetical protein n=1 Tax=Streptomyces sp. NPDC053499 TaxID=3365707 RepID=UPI0037D544F3